MSRPIFIADPYLLELGNNITVSVGVKFITHDNSVIKLIPNATGKFGIIKNNCFIGMNIIIGAGSLITKTFNNGNVVIATNPNKIICTIKE